jgi:hypothetical protein
MKFGWCALVFSFCGVAAGFAAPLIDEPLPSLELVSGTVLQNARAKSFGPKGVVVLHSAGLQTVPYEQFPPDLRPAVEAHKPQPKSPAQLQAERAQLQLKIDAENARLQNARRDQAARAQGAPKGVTREESYTPEQLKKVKSGSLWITAASTRGTVAYVTIENDSDYTTSFDWHRIHGLRRDQSYIEPTDARPSPGSLDFDVPKHDKREFTIGFGVYGYNGNPLTAIHWKD